VWTLGVVGNAGVVGVVEIVEVSNHTTSFTPTIHDDDDEEEEKDEKEDGQGEGYPTPSMMIHWHVVVDDSCSTNTTITTYFHQDEFTNNRYKID